MLKECLLPGYIDAAALKNTISSAIREKFNAVDENGKPLPRYNFMSYACGVGNKEMISDAIGYYMTAPADPNSGYCELDLTRPRYQVSVPVFVDAKLPTISVSSTKVIAFIFGFALSIIFF